MNKKKLFVFALAAAGVVPMMAETSLNWFSPLVSGHATAQTTIYDVRTTAQNDVYTLAMFGSHDAEPVAASFLNSNFTGAPYVTGTSYSSNLLLAKHDVAGNVQWMVHSNGGDVSLADCAFTPTADGGAFLAIKARHTNRNEATNNVLLRLVGADGQADSVLFEWPETTYHWIYQPVLARIDANGHITRMQKLWCDWSAAPTATTYSWGTSNGFYFYGAAEDEAGNLFVAGQLRRDMAIGTDTLRHHNTSTWDGDSQGSVGNAFVLKLNADLSYNTHLCSTGTSSYDTFKQLQYANGKLYLGGLISGDGTHEVGFGGQNATPPALRNIWATCLDAATLSANWLTIVPGARVNNKNAIQLNAMNLSNDANLLLLGGGAQGGVEVNGDTLMPGGTMYNAFALSVNTTNGAPLNGIMHPSISIGNTFGVMANTDSIYTYGYDWTSPSSVYLNSYSRTFVPNVRYRLLTGGGMATAWSMAAVGDTLLVGSRAAKNQAVSFLNSSENYTGTYSWYGLLSSFTFSGAQFTPTSTTPSTSVDNAPEAARVYAANGQINLCNAQGAHIRVYDLLGQRVAQFVSTNSHETLSLNHGAYVVTVNNKTVKVIL